MVKKISNMLTIRVVGYGCYFPFLLNAFLYFSSLLCIYYNIVITNSNNWNTNTRSVLRLTWRSGHLRWPGSLEQLFSLGNRQPWWPGTDSDKLVIADQVPESLAATRQKQDRRLVPEKQQNVQVEFLGHNMCLILPMFHKAAVCTTCSIGVAKLLTKVRAEDGSRASEKQTGYIYNCLWISTSENARLSQCLAMNTALSYWSLRKKQ